MEQIQIIKEPTKDKPFLVIYKPKNLPSAPLTPEDTNNALYQAIELYPDIKNVKGKKAIEYGLIHRLDTPTDGLLLIAVNQLFYDYIQNTQTQGGFIKTYTAKCLKLKNDISDYLTGFPHTPEKNETQFTITSYFRYFGNGNKEVRPVTKDSGKIILKKVGKLKEYNTNVKILKNENEYSLIQCSIKEGFKHQVRCHLAWAGYPIEGDEKYNPDKKNAEKQLCFSATKLEFEYPKGDLNSYEITFTWT